MNRIWTYAWAFAIMCFIYAGLKIAGVEWAAERSWTEVGIFVVVAVLIVVGFFLRKKIAAIVSKISNK